jgi:hypothetical protein
MAAFERRELSPDEQQPVTRIEHDGVDGKRGLFMAHKFSAALSEAAGEISYQNACGG